MGKIFFIIVVLTSAALKAQTFYVGDASCNYVLLNKSINLPDSGSTYSYTVSYSIDIDGDMVNDLVFTWHRYGSFAGNNCYRAGVMQCSSPTNYEIVYDPPISCNVGNAVIVQNLIFLSAINGSLNWMTNPAGSYIYDYNRMQWPCSPPTPQHSCGIFNASNPTSVYMGFRKILTNDTIYGWLYLRTNTSTSTPWGTKDEIGEYAYKHTSVPVISSNCNPSCSNQSITLNVSGPGTYTWSTGQVSPSITISPSITTSYSVNGPVNACDMGGYAVFTQTVYHQAVITNTESVICTNKNLILTATPPGGIFNGPDVSGNVLTPVNTGTQTVVYTYTNQGGCTLSDSITFTVQPSPVNVVITNTETTVCRGDTMILSGTPAGGTFYGIYVYGNNFVPSAYGTYTVAYSYTNSSGCSLAAVKSFTSANCVGINEINFQRTTYKISPNPNSGEFEIKGTKEEVIIISNELGQEVATKHLNPENNYSVKLDNLQSGVYFIGNKLSRQKIVVIK